MDFEKKTEKRKSSLSPFIAFLAVLEMSIAPLAAAAETIRVVVSQQTESVTLTSSQGIILRTSDGATEPANVRSVTISASTIGSGLLVDGERLRTNLIEVRGRNGEVILNGVTLPGRLIVKRENDRLLVINELDLEEYVKGVVPAEMNPGWHPEALKVQAIAARTYALYQIRLGTNKEFDIFSSTKDQVYRGRDGITSAVVRAVDQTRHQILTFGDSPIFAAYHSTAAGPTEDASNVWAMDFPYLKGVECPFDMESPHYQWRTDVALPHLERRLREEGYPIGVIASIDPASYSKSGRVAQIRILHSDGELYLRGEDLRRVIGYTTLASTQFDLEMIGLRIQFTGRGAGHGVGLCQWGAKVLAERGYGAETILRYYYPGTEIRDLRSLPRL
jgi:stage II sporulation protein D (peptidoglycan lytic transglycosylase)